MVGSMKRYTKFFFSLFIFLKIKIKMGGLF